MGKSGFITDRLDSYDCHFWRAKKCHHLVFPRNGNWQYKHSADHRAPQYEYLQILLGYTRHPDHLLCHPLVFSIRLKVLALILTGLAYILFDFRSAGAIAIIIGAMLLLNSRKNFSQIKILPLLIIGGLAGFAIKTTLEITSDKLETRRSTSSVSRSAAIKIGTQAIIDSPLIGSGSWGNNTEKYARQLYEETRDKMRKLGQPVKKARFRFPFTNYSKLDGRWIARCVVFYILRLLAIQIGTIDSTKNASRSVHRSLWI